jgi:NAD(P)H-hydrate repair Nnr-like enzyme with NAD(P)H-hydrate epimerase domain
MSVLTVDLIRKSEENAVVSGAFSFRELMYIAGTKAADIIYNNFDCENKKIAVICGNGNNGGDGFVIAESLAKRNAEVTIITPLGEPKTEDAIYYYSKSVSVKKSDSYINVTITTNFADMIQICCDDIWIESKDC